MSQLDSCRLRIERAHDARLRLNREILDYFDHVHPHAITLDLDPDRSDRAIVSLVPPATLPGIWQVTIGEILHNIRAALDNLTWALAEAHFGAAPSPIPDGSKWRLVQFPIYNKQGSFEAATQRWSSLLNPDDWAIFDQVQPYQRGDEYGVDLLWRLAELSNADKHRALHLLAMVPIGVGMGITNPIQVVECRDAVVQAIEVNFRPGPCRGKTELGRVTFRRTGPEPYVRVREGFGFQISIDQPAVVDWNLDVIGILGYLSDYASRVIERFAVRFP